MKDLSNFILLLSIVMFHFEPIWASGPWRIHPQPLSGESGQESRVQEAGMPPWNGETANLTLQVRIKIVSSNAPGEPAVIQRQVNFHMCAHSLSLDDLNRHRPVVDIHVIPPAFIEDQSGEDEPQDPDGLVIIRIEDPASRKNLSSRDGYQVAQIQVTLRIMEP